MFASLDPGLAVTPKLAGEIVKRIASSGQPVEYGQALFAIRAR